MQLKYINKKRTKKERYKILPLTSGLPQGEVFARRKSCRTFKRSRPCKLLCSPALQQASTTLWAMRQTVSNTDEKQA
jgi:hypothetical protein